MMFSRGCSPVVVDAYVYNVHVVATSGFFVVTLI